MKKRIVMVFLVIVMAVMMITPAFAAPEEYTYAYDDTSTGYDSILFVIILCVVIFVGFAVWTHFYVKHHSDDDDYDDDLDLGSSGYRSGRRSRSRGSGRGGGGRGSGGGGGRR